MFNRRSFVQLILFLLIALPILIVIWDVVVHGQNVPYWDQWTSSANIAIRTAQGNLTFSDITRQHLEHRIVFTNLQTAIFTDTTHWNIHLEMFVNIVVAIINLCLLIGLYYRFQPSTTPAMAVILSALVFSIRQRENWLWAFQSQWYFVIMFFLLALLMLSWSTPKWYPLIGAAICSFCAAFSFGAGILVFPILVLVLWVLEYRRWSYFLFWMVATLATIFLYFAHYTFSDNEMSTNVFKLSFYFLAYLGSPFVYRTPLLYVSVFFGLAGTCLFIFNLAYLRKIGYRWKQLVIWLALTAFSWGGGLLATPNRINNGMDSALTSRYTTLSTLFWVALIALTIPVITHILEDKTRQTGRNRVLINFNMLIISFLLGFYLMENYQILRTQPLVTEESKNCYLNYSKTKDFSCLKEINLVFDPAYLHSDLQPETLRTLEKLEEEGLTAFSDKQH